MVSYKATLLIFKLMIGNKIYRRETNVVFVIEDVLIFIAQHETLSQLELSSYIYFACAFFVKGFYNLSL